MPSTPCQLKWHRDFKFKMVHFLNEVKMQRGCIDCGYNDNYNALQFDHVIPGRRSVLDAASAGMKAVLSELEKVEVRCANCHAIKTAERRRLAKVG